MLPPDVASRLHVAADAALRPVAEPQEISDALADLIPGQRMMAEIRALMPNGTYRAVINQRDITLALPFSARAGDSLELEVVDNNGRIAFAVVSRHNPEQAAADPAVRSTLSRTGSLIADLMRDTSRAPGQQATALNGNQPLLSQPAATGNALAPALQQAISRSGMFYEAHQAQWVSGQKSIAELRAEPQGQRPPIVPPATLAGTARPLSDGTLLAQIPTGAPATPTASYKAPSLPPAASSPLPSGTAPPAEQARPVTPGPAPGEMPQRVAGGSNDVMAQTRPPGGILMAPDLAPLVQQQLDALATQNFVWQGLAWPGQPMRWEIQEEERPPAQSGEDEEASAWQTRLNLQLPSLGDIRAQLSISAGAVRITLQAADDTACARLADERMTLMEQLQAAGLRVDGVSVTRHEQDTA